MIKVTETSGESFVFSHVVPIAPAHSPAAGKEKSWVKGFGWIVQTYHHNRQTAQTRGQMISPPCMRHDTSLLSYLPRSSIVLLFKKKNLNILCEFFFYLTRLEKTTYIILLDLKLTIVFLFLFHSFSFCLRSSHQQLREPVERNRE